MLLAEITGLFTGVLMLLAVGLLVLRRESGWWALGLVAVVALVRILAGLGSSFDLARDVRHTLPLALLTLGLGAIAVHGTRQWGADARTASGRGVLPETPDRRTRTRLVAVAVVALVVLVVMPGLVETVTLAAGPGMFLAVVCTTLTSTATLVGLAALAERWRAGFALLGAAGAVQLVLVVVLAVAATRISDGGGYTTSAIASQAAPGAVQSLLMVALAVWGWRAWSRLPGREAGRPAYGQVAHGADPVR
ncbi:nicotinamide mononucleotide transporter [Arsenicicoccus sp. UBA7492]|uniref:nicotinamide mononucleotide transporter n=1 Tax=Arsenicicoccus sp. UBA7492 TaxID=1946057 RepID=UPI00257F7206|nr:nicotinamide mononucleotide transporter [Arsenicicoccus sp. UBA7492]